jgi:hypothetical protein
MADHVWVFTHASQVAPRADGGATAITTHPIRRPKLLLASKQIPPR